MQLTFHGLYRCQPSCLRYKNLTKQASLINSHKSNQVWMLAVWATATEITAIIRWTREITDIIRWTSAFFSIMIFFHPEHKSKVQRCRDAHRYSLITNLSTEMLISIALFRKNQIISNLIEGLLTIPGQRADGPRWLRPHLPHGLQLLFRTSGQVAGSQPPAATDVVVAAASTFGRWDFKKNDNAAQSTSSIELFWACAILAQQNSKPMSILVG